MGRRTPLFDLHQELGARIVDFGGWDMPVQYSSQIDEHHAVRRGAGVFDVSHMCVIDLAATKRARRSCSGCSPTTSASSSEPGKALYSCMLNETRRRHRRSHRLLPRRHLVPRGRERRHARQGPRVDPPPRHGLRRRRHRAHGSRDARRAGPEARAKSSRSCCRRRARRQRSRSQPFFGARDRRLVRRPHRLHRRRRLRDHAARRAMPCASGSELNAHGRRVLRPRRARHAAPRSRHESLRQRHGRDDASARVRPRLDRRLRARDARLHRPRSARSRQGARQLRASSSGCCSKIAACCAAIRKSSSPASAKAKSRAAPSRPRSSAPSRFARVPAGTGGEVQVDIRGKLLNARVVKPPFVRNRQAAHRSHTENQTNS